MEKLTAAFDVSKKNSFVKVGKPYVTICKLADLKKVDLIVIGTHSKRGIKAVVGSTANAVVTHASCDVTLVRIK